MTDCVKLEFRISMLERELARKELLIHAQAEKLDRLTGWIDAMLKAAEARQDELVARDDRSA